MNSKQIRGLSVINIADGTQVGTVDQVYLDLAAKRVVGFSITDGVGPFGGARDNAPTVAASSVHSLGPNALTLDDVAAAHAAWVGGAYGPLETLHDLVGRKVITEGVPMSARWRRWSSMSGPSPSPRWRSPQGS